MFARVGKRVSLQVSSHWCRQLTRASRIASDDLAWVTTRDGSRVRVDKLGYRPNVAVVLFNDEGEVLTCRRISKTSGNRRNWQYPQGGIEPGESPEDAALRELAEETSVRHVRIVAQLSRWLHYDFDEATQARLGALNVYRGQKQCYLLVRFLGRSDEICLEVDGHQAEFDSWRWGSIWEAAGSVAAFKADVYEEVAKEFAPVIAQAVGREAAEL